MPTSSNDRPRFRFRLRRAKAETRGEKDLFSLFLEIRKLFTLPFSHTYTCFWWARSLLWEGP